MKAFKITEKQGHAYSLESKDRNKIHLDNLIGYNSIFNHKIVYGTLIFYKVLNQFNYKKLSQYSIKIQFKNAFKAFRYSLRVFGERFSCLERQLTKPSAEISIGRFHEQSVNTLLLRLRIWPT